MSVNKVILIGNVGKEPEIRYVDNNVPIARFTLATSERPYTNAAGNQVNPRTDWHNIVVWRNLAEIAEKYVHKGTQLYIEGRISYGSWVDKSGVTRYTTEIIADSLQLLGKRSDDKPASETKHEESSPAKPADPAPATLNDVNDNPF